MDGSSHREKQWGEQKAGSESKLEEGGGEQNNGKKKKTIRQLISLNKSINILQARADAVWNWTIFSFPSLGG